MGTEDADYIASIAEAFGQAAPANWTEIHVEAPSITEVTAFTARATLPTGELESFYIEDDDLEEAVIDQIEALRRSMAGRNDGRGAWFTMTLDISSDDTFAVQFDYDSRPAFDFEVSQESLLADLKVYPRSDAFYPDWLPRD